MNKMNKCLSSFAYIVLMYSFAHSSNSVEYSDLRFDYYISDTKKSNLNSLKFFYWKELIGKSL